MVIYMEWPVQHCFFCFSRKKIGSRSGTWLNDCIIIISDLTELEFL